MKTSEVATIENATGIAIHRIDSRSFLHIGAEQVEVSEYTVKSSANGITELNVTISGNSNVFEMLANLGEPQKLNQ